MLFHVILVSSWNCPKFTKTRDFSKHFLLPLFGGKTQSSVEFQNSIFHSFYFNDSYFITVIEVLFLMHYPLQKHFKKGYIFSVFSLGSVFLSSPSGFKSQNFYSLSWATRESLWVSLTKINRNHKTRSSKQKRW